MNLYYENKSQKPKIDKTAIVTVCVIVAIIVLSLVIALIVMHAQEIDKVKKAVLFDCLDSVNEDYIITIEKCEYKATEVQGAKLYLVHFCTEEDGFQVLYVRIYKGDVGVYEVNLCE